MSTRKYRYDPETGLLSPISIGAPERTEPVHSPLLMRAIRLLLIVGALAVSATVFSLAHGQAPAVPPPTSDGALSPAAAPASAAEAAHRLPADRG